MVAGRAAVGRNTAGLLHARSDRYGFAAAHAPPASSLMARRDAA